MQARQYVENRTKNQAKQQKSKIDQNRNKQYRISNAKEMTAEELIHALRDKIQEIL